MQVTLGKEGKIARLIEKICLKMFLVNFVIDLQPLLYWLTLH